MKEYVMLIRLPINYGPTQAAVVRDEWTKLIDHWKENHVFVTSFIFPSDSYVVSSSGTSHQEVISNDLRVISNIIVRANNFEEALALANKCPILKQGGTVEVREAQPRPIDKSVTEEESKNKEIIRNLYENVLNNRKYDLLNDVISPTYAGAGNEQTGVKSFLYAVQLVINALPDIKWTIVDILADEDKVTVRWTWTGTHTQPFRGIAATNKKVTDNAIVIYQLLDGKVINSWIQSDRLGFLMQIGIIPKDLVPAPASKKN